MVRLLLLCSFFAHFLEAKILEAPHFRDLLPYAKEETLVILDIDDTLLVPVQMLGCDEWFCHRMRLYQQEGMEAKAALERTVAEWQAVRHLTQMEIVEPGTEELIRKMQDEKIAIMGLTTQGLSLATRTWMQLKEAGIDLLGTAPVDSDHYFLRGHLGILYRHGILFTSGAHKGETLFHFLDLIGLQPKTIVFVNDKATHLAEVEAVAQQRSIDFIGLRYGFSDGRKRAFRPEIADYQFDHSSFSHILSDSEALALVDR